MAKLIPAGFSRTFQGGHTGRVTGAEYLTRTSIRTSTKSSFDLVLPTILESSPRFNLLIPPRNINTGAAYQIGAINLHNGPLYALHNYSNYLRPFVAISLISISLIDCDRINCINVFAPKLKIDKSAVNLNYKFCLKC